MRIIHPRWYRPTPLTHGLNHSVFPGCSGCLNTFRPTQNGRHVLDGSFKNIFWMKCMDFDDISLKFVPKGPINNIPALVQIMAWRRPGDKPLSEPWWLYYWRIYASFGVNELRYMCNRKYVLAGESHVLLPIFTLGFSDSTFSVVVCFFALVDLIKPIMTLSISCLGQALKLSIDLWSGAPTSDVGLMLIEEKSSVGCVSTLKESIVSTVGCSNGLIPDWAYHTVARSTVFRSLCC